VWGAGVIKNRKALTLTVLLHAINIIKKPLIKSLRRHAGEPLHGCRRYDSRDGIARVESGTKTEGDARLHGCRR